MERRNETWESFWAQLWRIDFFEGQWDAYHKAAKARAEWLREEFALDPALPVLSCCCGEAGIEIALAQEGFNVTGIDKCPVFIHYAREEAGKAGLSATFLTADLRTSQPGSDRPLPGGNGCVFCFDTLGLLSGDDELALVRRMIDALEPNGVLLLDAPKREDQANSRVWWPLRDGYLLQETRWDKAAGELHTEPVFLDGSQAIMLADPFDQTRGEHSGVIRHIYTPDELLALVRQAGLFSEIVSHQRRGYNMVVARKTTY